MYWLAALFCVVVWGTTFISSKVLLLHGLSPDEIILLRFGLAWLCLVPFYRKDLRLPWREEAWMLLVGVLGGSLYFMTENSALRYTLTTNVSLIVSLNPLYTLLIVSLLYRTVRLTPALVCGVVMAVLGVFCVVMNGHVLLQLNPLGDLLALACGLSWTFYSLAYERVSRHHSALLITRKLFFWGFVTCLPLHLLTRQPKDYDAILAEPAVWGNLLFLALVAGLVCFFVWNLSVNRIGTVRANNLLYFSPLVTLLTAHFVLAEPLTLMSLLGMVLTVAGVWLATGWMKKGRTSGN